MKNLRTYLPVGRTKIIIVIFLISFLVLPLANVLAGEEPASENVVDKMKGAIGSIQLPNGGEDADATVNTVIGKLVGGFLSLLGVIFFILMIYGGFKWMMAKGQEEEVKSAKDIIRSAIIGLILMMLAYTITYFVTSALQSSV